MTFALASWLLVAGLIVQVFLAGLGVFDSPERFELHASFGFTLMALPMIMLLSGLAGAVGRRFIGLAALMFALFFLQSILVSLRGQVPAVAALHPLNGFLILFVSIMVARGSVSLRRSAVAKPEPVA
jgi:cytochrome b561